MPWPLTSPSRPGRGWPAVARMPTKIQRYRGVLKKYPTSHLWDLGVPQGPLNYAASYPNVFLSGELVANGGFDSDTWWTKTGSASISGGLGHLLGTSSLERGSFATANRAYNVTATVTIRSGTVRLQIGGDFLSVTSSGTYSVVLRPTATTLYLVGMAGVDADIDNVSVREVYASSAAEFLAAYPLWPLWQDTAGTVPACKINDPVGLCLDQPTGVVTLGPELVPAITPAGTGWGNSGVGSTVITFGAGTITFVTDGLSVGVASFTGSGVAGRTYQINVAGTGTGQLKVVYGGAELIFTQNLSCRVVFGETGTAFYFSRVVNQSANTVLTSISVREVIGAHAGQATTTKRPILSGRVNLLTATTTLSTQPITTLAASYKLTFTGSGTVTLSGTYSGSLVGGGSLTFTATAGTLTLTVTGSVTFADLRPSNSPTNIPAYQRVTSATDYDTVGFPVRALFDGVDDCLVVPSLDLSMTDKVTVVAGVMKYSDVSVGIVAELTANLDANNGAFWVAAPVNLRVAGCSFSSKGTAKAALKYENTLIAAPASIVVSGIANISGPALTQKTNGAILTTSASQGTGNFSASAFNIGGRNNAATLPFNGAIQSLAVIGNLLPDGEVQILEASANAAMGKVY